MCNAYATTCIHISIIADFGKMRNGFLTFILAIRVAIPGFLGGRSRPKKPRTTESSGFFLCVLPAARFSNCCAGTQVFCVVFGELVVFPFKLSILYAIPNYF